MLNEVVLIGRLGKDSETRETSNGTKVATIALPLFHSYSPDGKKTEWVQCEAYGKLSNIVEMAKKGVLVTIRGELHVQSWEDDSGNYRTRTFVKIDSFRFLEKRKTEKTNEEITETVNEEIPIEKEEDTSKMTDVDKFLSSF